MSYTTDGITLVSQAEHDLGRVIRATTSHTGKTIQCYFSGRLVASQRPRGGAVAFVLAEPADEDVVLLLAVDEADAGVNYWDEAFAESDERGNRIVVETPQTILTGDPGDRWQVYIGQADDAEATLLVCDREFHPGGRRSGGWGKHWGRGGWGLSALDCAGWGGNWGIGEHGFDCEMLSCRSEPMGPGTYPVKVIIADAHGNESSEYADTITLDTYPRPASELSVTSYDRPSDTLTLTFEPSPDDGA